MGIIEMIHRDFFSQYEKIAEDMGRSHSARTDSDLVEVTRNLEAAGFTNSKNVRITTEDEHNKLVRAFDLYKRYLIDAPGYRFITRDQVIDLCRKYALVWGETGFFIGDIPRENAAHISQFRVNPSIIVPKGTGDMWNGQSISSMLDFHLANTLLWICTRSVSNGWKTNVFDKRLDQHALIVLREMHKRFSITVQNIPVTSDTVNRWTVENNIKSNMLEFHKIVDHATLMERHAVLIRAHMCEGLEAIIKEATRDQTFSQQVFDLTKVNFKVVANKEMFDLKGRVVNDDCEIVPAAQPESLRWTRADFEDPIVLAEVDGGYLIVTAWGAEAVLDDVINFNNN